MTKKNMIIFSKLTVIILIKDLPVLLKSDTAESHFK